MATKTLLTAEQYAALEEPEGVRYELSEGELIVTPSASLFHNALRDELNSRNYSLDSRFRSLRFSAKRSPAFLYLIRTRTAPAQLRAEPSWRVYSPGSWAAGPASRP